MSGLMEEISTELVRLTIDECFVYKLTKRNANGHRCVKINVVVIVLLVLRKVFICSPPHVCEIVLIKILIFNSQSRRLGIRQAIDHRRDESSPM
jgi:hypothetical protein